MAPVQIIETIISGIVGGFICGLTGMGGGAIYVPIFYFLFGFSIKEAIGTSLLVIAVSSVSAFLVHMKEKRINFRITGFLIGTGIVGALIGSRITAILPEETVKIFFVFLTIFLSVNMWRNTTKNVENCDAGFNLSPFKFLLIGLTGGIVSGMGGVGGAIVLVPLLHIWIGISMNVCIVTALSVVMFNSLSGVIGYFYHGFVNIPTGIITGIIAVIFASVGAKVSIRMDNKKLRKIFSIILLIAGMAVLIRR